MLPLHFRLDVVIDFVSPNSNRCGEQQCERENVLAFEIHSFGPRRIWFYGRRIHVVVHQLRVAADNTIVCSCEVNT
jgi:hypothetical protein